MGLRQLQTYTQQMYTRIGIPQTDATIASGMFNRPVMYLSAVVGLAVYAVVAWILIHFHPDFQPSSAKSEPH